MNEAETVSAAVLVSEKAAAWAWAAEKASDPEADVLNERS
jgi:hypothetical protein